MATMNIKSEDATSPGYKTLFSDKRFLFGGNRANTGKINNAEKETSLFRISRTQGQKQHSSEANSNHLSQITYNTGSLSEGCSERAFVLRSMKSVWVIKQKTYVYCQ